MAYHLFHILPPVEGGLALGNLSAPLIEQALVFLRDFYVIQANPHLPPEFLHDLEFALDGQLFDFRNTHPGD
jgi:hypothetical protein